MFLKFFLGAKKRWGAPRKSPILIFDCTQKDVLLADLAPWNPEVLDVGGGELSIPVLLGSFSRPGKSLDAYIDSFIERVQPRLIVTLIDNRLDFYTISARHPGVKTLFLQNGYRGYYCDIFEVLDTIDPARLQGMRVDYMLTFGKLVSAEYSRYIAGEGKPMGSLKSNRTPRRQPVEPGVIAYISQGYNDGFMMGGKFYSGEDFFTGPDRLVVDFLRDYAERKGKRLKIIPRRHQPGPGRTREIEHFRALLGREPEFLEPDGAYPSYEAVDAAEVVVAIDSTLSYESVARGNKTGIFTIRSALFGIPKLTYGWPGEFPDDGPFWTNRPERAAFERVLDYLFQVDAAQWRKDVDASGFKSIITHDPGNTVLKSILHSELGPPPGGD